jgi:hypothetical protein
MRRANNYKPQKIRDNSRNSWLKKSSYAKATADATYLSEVKCQKQKQQLQKNTLRNS